MLMDTEEEHNECRPRFLCRWCTPAGALTVPMRRVRGRSTQVCDAIQQMQYVSNENRLRRLSAGGDSRQRVSRLSNDSQTIS